MRRFSLYRRGRIWYAAFYNPTTKRYADAKSTRETSRNSALLRAAEWDKWGIPELGGRRAVMDTLSIDTILETIRQTELTAKDAARIISALKARDLIEQTASGKPARSALHCRQHCRWLSGGARCAVFHCTDVVASGTRRFLIPRLGSTFRAPTGESDRRAAEHVVDDWLRDGIPERRGKHRRPSAEVFEISALVQAIRKAPLTAPDAEQIVRALKDHELIETAVLKTSPGLRGP